MKVINDIVKQIDEEIQGSKGYAEKYLELKSRNDSNWSNKFKQMATDELNHAIIIHDYAVQEIENLEKVYTPPSEMLDIWKKSHAEYVEKVAWIKQMLTM